jgi:hypothetical protein
MAQKAAGSPRSDRPGSSSPSLAGGVSPGFAQEHDPLVSRDGGGSVGAPVPSERSPEHLTAARTRLITTRDVARQFDATDQWVLDQVRAGELRAIKANARMFRYRQSDVDDFVRRHLSYSDVAAAVEAVAESDPQSVDQGAA